MYKVLRYIIFSVFFAAAFITANAQTLIYYDNFNTAGLVWKDYDDALSNAKLTGGKYILTHKQQTSSIVLAPVTIDYNRDFAIETTLSHVSGNATYPVGIAFGAANSLNMYYFTISSTGQFVVAAFQQGVNKIIINWTPSTAILQGNVPNKLRVEKSENEFKYFINDIQVGTGQVLIPFGNSMGLMVSGQQSVAFDYIKATYLDPVTTSVFTNTKQVSADILETAYRTDFTADDNNQWVFAPQGGSSSTIANGFFVVTRTQAAGLTESVTVEQTKVDMQRDYVIETAAVHYSGNTSFGYGIDFACDEAKQYHFWITPAGYYSIGYTQAGKYNDMTPWTVSPAIVRTAMRMNKLSMVHKAGQLIFYINDQQVTTYPDMAFTGHRFGVSVAADQSVGFDYLTFGYLDKAKVVAPQNTAVANADVTPPEITITSPGVMRGLKVVQASEVVHVAGIAKDASGIFSVVVNGTQAKVEPNGSFTADVPLDMGDNPLMVVATDMNMNKGNYRFNIVRNKISAGAVADVSKSAAEGKYYALLIGEQDYQDKGIQSLDGPVTDATNLQKALADNYTFSPENLTLLKNPTRAQFFKAFDDISAKLTPQDNLVVFYAGHGFYDEERKQGYWFPSDASKTRKDTWISNADLIDYITAIKAKHTLLISDACFAGSIFKTRAIEMAPKDIQELYKLPSRKAMTSGNMKEVPDNSVFMHYLIERLKQNTDKFLPAEQLFSSFRAAVINNSPNQQVPQFGEIREAGDEGGDFIFIKKGN